MSKKVKYFCNLCGDEKPTEELAALYWNGHARPQTYQLVLDVTVCDKHICHGCIAVVRDLESVVSTKKTP